MEQKEKTIREWLETLPEPYRTQAIENTSDERMLRKYSSVKISLPMAFSWHRSKQGYEYWSKFHKTL